MDFITWLIAILTVALHVVYTLFFISNTFISNARLKLAKNQVNAKETLKLNFFNLKIIHILHSRYHPNILDYTINHNENEDKNEK